MKYATPGTEGSLLSFKPRYEHFIGNEWIKPVRGQYFEETTPITGEAYTEVARGTAADIEAALDAAHAAAKDWGADFSGETFQFAHEDRRPDGEQLRIVGGNRSLG